MSTVIASFNSRGVEVTSLHDDKPRKIRDLLSSAAISLLQETHSPTLHNNKTLQSIFPSSDIFLVPGTGSSGGLCSSFQSGSIPLLHSQSDSFLSIYLKDIQPFNISAFIINVYLNSHRPSEDAEKLISYVKSLPIHENIIIMGDFNLDPRGKSSKSFISVMGRLHDLGIRHIQTNQPTRFGGSGQNPSYIDHVFVRLPPSLSPALHIRPVSHSDHVAIFLHLSSSRKPCGRSVVASAFSDPTFAEFILHEHHLRPLSSNYHKLISSLHHLAHVFSNLKTAPDSSPLFLFDMLHAFQTRNKDKWNDVAARHGFHHLNANSISELSRKGGELSNLFFLHNSPFFLGSKIKKKWCLEYLRSSIPSSYHSLLRHVIGPDGQLVNDPTSAGKLLHSVWSKQFASSETTHHLKPFLDKLDLPSYHEFLVDLSDEKILETINSLSNDSAPGPDGITNTLIKGASEIFTPVVRRILKQMSSGSLPSNDFLSGFINFIEKKDCQPTPGNLRPITIPNSIHRLVGKLVSDQMQPFLAKNIHPSQSAFINNRWITNNVRRVHDVINRRGSGWLLFVDFSKAYDSVDRQALLQIMKSYRFHPSVTAFVKTALLPYQINSRIFDLSITVERGVPQGWSLSCVLFNLVIDPLLRSLDTFHKWLFKSAFADDLAFSSIDWDDLPVLQQLIDEYGGAVGLSVNQRKCAVINLGPDDNPIVTNSIWDSPVVKEYKYLGVLLGKKVNKALVFQSAFEKLRTRVNLFLTVRWSFTSRILIANIYLYPLLSYLLNFFSLPPSLENSFMANISRFVFPIRNIKRQLLFAHQHILAKPTIIHPRTYATSFLFTDSSRRIFHLLEPSTTPKVAPDLVGHLLLEKLAKLSLPSSEAVYNFSLLTKINYKLSHFMTRCITNSLPFYSRIHHFAPDSPHICALCGLENGDDPRHLFSSCPYCIDSTILLRSEYPQLSSDFSSPHAAFLGLRQFSAADMVIHCAFAKTLWKARCIALFSNVIPNPLFIIHLFKKLLRSCSIPRETPKFTSLVSSEVISSFLNSSL